MKLDEAMKLEWSKRISKIQYEEFQEYKYPMSQFDVTKYRTFYAGIFAFQTNNQLHLLINDHPTNEKVIEESNFVRITEDFNSSNSQIITINETTGEIERKTLTSRNDVPIIEIPSVYQYKNLIYTNSRFLGSRNNVFNRLGKITVSEN